MKYLIVCHPRKKIHFVFLFLLEKVPPRAENEAWIECEVNRKQRKPALETNACIMPNSDKNVQECDASKAK